MRIAQNHFLDYTKNDVSLLLDLLPHPLSILQHIMDLTHDTLDLESLNCVSSGIDQAVIIGITQNNMHILLELDNTAPAKYRHIIFHNGPERIAWTSNDPVISNSSSDPDALTRHLHLYFAQTKPLVSYMDVAKMIDKLVQH